jgi:hypothetical protein
VRGPTRNKAPANLTRGIKFTLSKRPSTSDGIPWSTVCRSLRLREVASDARSRDGSRDSRTVRDRQDVEPSSAEGQARGKWSR